MSALIAAQAFIPAPGGANVLVLDATYYLPNEGKDGREVYTTGHIPGARFLDIDEISDKTSTLPHMLPRPEDFARMAAELGARGESKIVIYDQRGLFSAARAWWMFRVFGHDNVFVLDGGLPAWIAAGGALESGIAPDPEPGAFTAKYRPEMVRSISDILKNLESGTELVLDARAAGRFEGTVPEPRPGMRSGHIPGAKSLPFSELLAAGFLRPPEDLRARFATAGVDGAKPVVTSCGSGVTAAVLTLALHEAGLPEGAIYDGSWAEWGARDDTPVETV